MKFLPLIPMTLAAASLLLASCNSSELASTMQKNDSLVAVINEQETTINDFVTSFNEVEISLDSVTAKQQIIYYNTQKSGREFQPGQKDRINTEIKAINFMMEQNQKTISELTAKLKKSGRKNTALEKTIATLHQQIFQKNLELTNLNDQLNLLDLQVAQLKVSVDTLTMQNSEQAQTISEKNTALHTAYYIVGKSKELQEAKLIDKQGGLLGIGRTSTLNANIDNSKFFKIDYTQTSTIPINSNHAKIITSHPADSYTLAMKNDKEVTSLVIIDPEKFWSASKYLVIVNN